MGTTSDDNRVLNAIFRRKVVTVDVLSSFLSSSVKTARRRLRLWEAYTRAPGKNQEKKLVLFRQNSSIAAQADF